MYSDTDNKTLATTCPGVKPRHYETSSVPQQGMNKVKILKSHYRYIRREHLDR